jgi:hypothetical protein
MRIIPARIVNRSMLDLSRLIRYKRSDFVVIVSSLKKGRLRCGTIPADLRTLFDAVSIGRRPSLNAPE